MKACVPPLVLSVFASFAVGGPQVRFAAVANHHGRAFRHAIIAMDGCFDCTDRLSTELDLIVLKPPWRRAALVANLGRFRAVIRDVAPSVLVTHNWGSMEWAVANLPPGGVRHLHVEDGFGPEERNGQLQRRVLTRRFVLRHSTVVLPSQTLLRIATDVWRLSQRRLRYVPNGLDIERFRPQAAPAVEPPGPPTIGSVSVLRPEKNLGRLLRAGSILRDRGADFRLEVVGDGPERGKLEALSRSLGLMQVVQFAGAVADPASAYRNFDIFALSSDTEQMPLSVLEAMASGLPVAATAVGDVPQMLADENRQFLAARSDEDLANVLMILLRERSLRLRLGAANRIKAARDYDQGAMFQAYGGLFSASEPHPESFQT